MILLSRLLPCAVLLVCIACAGTDSDVDGSAQDANMARDTAAVVTAPQDTAPAGSARPRPETIRDTVMIEGIAEVETASLVSTPANFPLPFSTYLPEGMRAEFADDGSRVRFIAAFGGTVNPDAYVQVSPAMGDARAAADSIIRSARGSAAEVSHADAPSWAEGAARFMYRNTAGDLVSGRVTSARHSGRVFHVVHHYPAEYADGMGPRIDRILRHWRWEDTGAMLVR
jgi:hypothetical protein